MNDRIVERASEIGMKQKDIVSRMSASKGSVSKWFNGTSKPSSDNLVELATILRTTSDWLSTGRDSRRIKEPAADYNVEALPPLNRSDEVPVISMVQAGNWSEAITPYEKGEGESPLSCPYPHGENTFAVKVKGDSMLDEFPEGMILFIDPSQRAENKDYVIAKLSDTNEATFKQYVIEDGKEYLKAINPNWPTTYTAMNGNCHLIGKLIGVYKKY